ncbi:GTPase [Novispirillum sp. DQ9]|uniref:GTPase n=1 Tax=Novispirillum sp. DQ9 TaxID=3398612 RepID=UPI003C7A74FC
MMLPEFKLSREILDEIGPLIKRYLGASDLDALRRFMDERATSAKPVVMVYGVYNAGKSTLLNALIGEERAKVAARPETDKVTPYEWDGFTIYDTPGIDAPMEHERISREHLEKCDVILFVLSSDGTFDEKETYDEICTIIKGGKPVQVILNNRGNLTDADEACWIIRDKIVSNLQIAAAAVDIADVERKVQVRLVNAKTALKGRLLSDPDFIEASGLPLLIEDLRSFLHKADVFDVVRTCSRQVAKKIDLTLAALPSSAGQTGIRDALSTLEGEKQRVHAAVLLAIQQATVSFRGPFRSAVENQNEAAAEAAVAAVQEQVGLAFKREIATAANQLDAVGAQLERADAPAHGKPLVNTAIDSEDAPVGGGAAADSLLLVKNALTQVPEAAVREGVVQALKLGKELLPGAFRGIGPVTMGKYATTVTKGLPWIGPVIDIAIALISWYRAEEARRQEEAAQRRRAAAIAERVEDAATQIRIQLQADTAHAIDDYFAPIEYKLQELVRQLDASQATIEEDRARLLRAKGRLEAILVA